MKISSNAQVVKSDDRKPCTTFTTDGTEAVVKFSQISGDTYENLTKKTATSNGKMVSSEQYKKLKMRDEEVRKHEQAHQFAGGSLASSPVYEYNEYGLVQNGHVDIVTPELNKENPEETLKLAKVVKDSASAPSSFSELSDADKSVIAKADGLITNAQNLIDKKLYA